jgi:Transposase, Mutator family
MRQLASPKVRGSQNDIGNENPQSTMMWVLKLYVQFSFRMNTRCPIGHDSEIFDTAGSARLTAASVRTWCVLNEEMTEHLGYEKHEPAGAGTGNIRNGTRAKTVLTDTTGQVEIDVPRDRAATFEPQTVKKRQRRLSGVDEVVLSLYAHRRLRCSAGCSAAACVDRDPSIAVTLANATPLRSALVRVAPGWIRP